MTRKNLLCALLSALVMIGLPWCAVTFLNGDGGMALCLLLFFAADPLFALGLGTFSGWNGKAMWFQPLICAGLFLVGTWLLFDPGETAFLLYAGIYLALGYAAAVIGWVLKKIRR